MHSMLRIETKSTASTPAGTPVVTPTKSSFFPSRRSSFGAAGILRRGSAGAAKVYAGGEPDAKAAPTTGKTSSRRLSAEAMAEAMVKRLQLDQTPASSGRRLSVGAPRRSSALATPSGRGHRRSLEQAGGDAAAGSPTRRQSALRSRRSVRGGGNAAGPTLGNLETVARWLAKVIPTEKHTRQLRRWNACFSGTSALDWLLRVDGVHSRQQAAGLMRRLLAARYIIPLREADEGEEEAEDVAGDAKRLYRVALESSEAKEGEEEVVPASIEVVSTARYLADVVSTRDHLHHLRTFRGCILAKEAVDWLLIGGRVSSRAGARAVCQHLLDAGALLHAFGGDARPLRATAFKDDDSGYRVAAHVLASSNDHVTPEGHAAAMGDTDLQSLATVLRDVVPIRDHKLRFRTHQRSFFGWQAVDWLLRVTATSNRAQATALGQQLLRAKHLHHVLDVHDFEDSAQLFRFYLDADEEGQHRIALSSTNAGPRPSFDRRGVVRDEVKDISKIMAHSAQAMKTPKGGAARKDDRLKQLSAFVPARIVRHYMETQEPACAAVVNNKPAPHLERFEAAVLFADISGFSSLAEKLLKERLGNVGYAGEELSDYVGKSLAKMIAAIVESGGDVIKFAGDAVFAVYPASLFPDNDLASASRCATRCALDLIELPLQAGTTTLSVHCGVGVGTVIGMHVGGRYQRWEYVICGEPLTQVSAAEKDAEAGEVVVSPQVAELVRLPGSRRLDSGNFFVTHLDPDSQTPRPNRVPIATTVATLNRASSDAVRLAISRYVPRPVVLGIEAGSGSVAAELRVATIVFVKVLGLAVDGGNVDATRVQDVVLLVQDCMYKYEGTFCRFIIDDKGAGMLWAFGLPPLSHPNDAVLAVRAALETHYKVSRISLKPAPAPVVEEPMPALNIRVSHTELATPVSGSDSSSSSDDEDDADEKEAEADPKAKRHTMAHMSSPGTHTRIVNRWKGAMARVVRGGAATQESTQLPVVEERRRQSAFTRAQSFITRSEQAPAAAPMLGAAPSTRRQSSFSRLLGRQESKENLVEGVVRKWSTFKREDAAAAPSPPPPKEPVRTHMCAAIGITTGRVFLGGVGGDQRAEYTLHGTVVNLSARLMVAAKDGILTDETVFQSSCDTFNFEAPTQISVKNIEGLITVYRPLAIRAGQRATMLRQATSALARGGTDGGGGSRPNSAGGNYSGGASGSIGHGGRDEGTEVLQAVGREKELARLTVAVEKLLQPMVMGSVMIVEGEAGVGKKCLKRAIAHAASSRGAYVVDSYGMDIERSTPFFVWRLLLVGLLGPEILTAANARQLAERALPPNLASQLHLLLGVLPELKSRPAGLQEGEKEEEEEDNREEEEEDDDSVLDDGMQHAHAEDIGNLILSIVKHRAAAAVSETAIAWRQKQQYTGSPPVPSASASVAGSGERPSLIRRLSRSTLETSPDRQARGSIPAPSPVATGDQSAEDTSERRRLGPLVLIIEDAHWVDGLSWDLLLRVAAVVPHVLIVVTNEPIVSPTAAQAELRSLSKAEVIELGPLSKESVGALIAARLQVSSVPQQVVDMIYKKTQGHPLFTEEIVKIITASGVLRVDPKTRVCELHTEESGGDAWAEKLQLPVSISHMITSRIDSLMPSAAMTLQVASILGFVFRTDALLACYPTPLTWNALADDLAVLVDYGFVQRVSATLQAVEFKFKSSVIKDAAAELLLYSTRRAVHLKVAQYLEHRTTTSSYSASTSAIALHYLAAEEYTMAQTNFERAALQALEAYNFTEAVAALSKLLHLHPNLRADASNERQARWMRELALAYISVREPIKAERYLVELLRMLGLPRQRSGWKRRLELFRARRQRQPVLPHVTQSRGALLEACRAFQLLAQAQPALEEYALYKALQLGAACHADAELARVHCQLARVCLKKKGPDVAVADEHMHNAMRHWAAVDMQQRMGGGDDDNHGTKLFVHMMSGEYDTALGRWDKATKTIEQTQWLYQFLRLYSRELHAVQVLVMLARCQGLEDRCRYLVGVKQSKPAAGNKRRSSVSAAMVVHSSTAWAVQQAHVLAMLGDREGTRKHVLAAAGVADLEDVQLVLQALPASVEAVHALAAVLLDEGQLAAGEVAMLHERLLQCESDESRLSAAHGYLHVALVAAKARPSGVPGLQELGHAAVVVLQRFALRYPVCRVAYLLASGRTSSSPRHLRAAALLADEQGQVMDAALARLP